MLNFHISRYHTIFIKSGKALKTKLEQTQRMSATYKPVVIIMDDFTYRSLGYDNTTLYDAGQFNVVTSYDFYTLDGYSIDGYGDVDDVATTDGYLVIMKCLMQLIILLTITSL